MGLATVVELADAGLPMGEIRFCTEWQPKGGVVLTDNGGMLIFPVRVRVVATL